MTVAETGIAERKGAGILSVAPSIANVLLVEDSKVLAERLKELIDEVPGVRLLATVEGESDAVDTVAQADVDVIILDLQLRQGTGFGVLRKLSLRPTRPVVIVYTNYDLPEYRHAAELLGANHFLDKSRDYERLVKILSDLGAEYA
jgi:DNA-binding NarL/FixJ family response regulator